MTKKRSQDVYNDHDLWTRLVEAARLYPGNVTKIAETAGCSSELVRKSLKHGWPDAPFQARPIGLLLAEEQERARAARALASHERLDQTYADEDMLRADARETVLEEAKLSKSLRKTAFGVSEAMAELMPSITLCAEKLREELEDPENVMSPFDRTKLLRYAMQVVKDGAQICREVMDMERLRLGDPTKFLKANTDEMSLEDAVAELSALSKTIERAKAQGHVH